MKERGLSRKEGVDWCDWSPRLMTGVNRMYYFVPEMTLNTFELVTSLILTTTLWFGSCIIDTLYRKLRPRSVEGQLSGKLVGVGAETSAHTSNHLISLLLGFLGEEVRPVSGWEGHWIQSGKKVKFDKLFTTGSYRSFQALQGSLRFVAVKRSFCHHRAGEKETKNREKLNLFSK